MSMYYVSKWHEWAHTCFLYIYEAVLYIYGYGLIYVNVNIHIQILYKVYTGSLI